MALRPDRTVIETKSSHAGWSRTGDGREDLKRRRIGLVFILASVGFVIGVAIVGTNDHPYRNAFNSTTGLPGMSEDFSNSRDARLGVDNGSA